MVQAIIFILGWPLEWSEILIIFVPIFLPMLDNFGVNPCRNVGRTESANVVLNTATAMSATT